MRTIFWLTAVLLASRAALGQTPPVPMRLPPPLAETPIAPATETARADALWRLPPIDINQHWCLADIEQMALGQHPSLGKAAAQVEMARGEWLQSGLYPNPVFGIGQFQTGSQGLAEQDGVGLSQEFVLGGKLRLNRQVADRQLAQAQRELAVQELRVLTDARLAFYYALIAQRQQQLTTELVHLAAQGVENAQKRNAGNEVGKNDVLEARIELYRAEIQARNSGNAAAGTWRSLASAVGLADLPVRTLEGDLGALLDERSWPTSLAHLQQFSPEVAAAVASLEATRAQLARAAVEKIPDVTFEGFYNWRDNGIGGRPDGAFWFSVPVPLWDRNQGGVLRARGQIAAAERSLDQLQLELQNRLAAVFERYTNARFQVRQFRDLILPAAAEALELTRKSYQGGEADYDDLLTSQRTNAQANLDYLGALRDLWIAETELEGMLLSNSLESGD